MKATFSLLRSLVLSLILANAIGCSNEKSNFQNNPIDTEVAFNYLKSLEGKWIFQDGKEGIFGWEFELTSRNGVIVEHLKKGAPTEMLTIYNLDKEILRANHFCQLQNQPVLKAVNSEIEGDLHFICNGQVGNTTSHDELHMHGVHFQKNDTSLIIWMDMYENGKVDFETKYELFRIESEQGKKLAHLK